jgi:3-oxoacyl-[acyl-carrier protein] reductase
MFNLTGKTALITGATGGIGESIARKMKEQGAQIVLSGTRVDALEKLQKDLGEGVFIVPCSLNDKEAVENLIPESERLAGQIDILVNNAGITKDGLLMRMKDEDIEDVLMINLICAFKISRAAIRGMMKRRMGRIINISSIVGVTGNPGQTNYVASKAGLIGLTKSLAQEISSRNVTVNAIAPGFIETPMTHKLSNEIKTKLQEKIPLGRLGFPEDIAYGTVFLSSDEAAYITGQTLHINGGMAMI